MNRIAKFEKVSYEQFKKDWVDTFPNKFNELDDDVIDNIIRQIYDSIKLPKRATSGSAGHDFFSPNKFVIPIGGSIKIPTGIRCVMDNGWVLQLFPRSSYGFKYGAYLSNTVGIIDRDYAYADNEGNIFVKMINDSSIAKPIIIEKGDAFCQGVFVPYGVADEGEIIEKRHGGIGSTGN